MRRRKLFVAGGVVCGVAALGAAGATIVSNVKLPSHLSGLAFLPKPDAPRRSEIRIGRLPDMPEIVDGVPAVVGSRPVRVVETAPPAPVPPQASSALGPKPVAAAAVPASNLSRAPLPTTFTSASAPPMAMGPGPEIGTARIQAVSLGSSAQPAVRSSLDLAPSATVASRAVPEPTPVETKPVEAKVEPASTASVANPPAIVPVPPPAPSRAASRSPEPRPEKPARPSQVAARQAAAPPVTPASAENAVPAPPPEERVEILGMKLPNGSDLKNAVSSIGEALNLPKAF